MKKYLFVFLLTGIVLASVQPQVNTVGLIAHYKMWDGLMTEGKIFDYTCTGKDGTLVDTDATLIPTYPGFDFDGTEDYISIDDHDDFTPGGNNLVTNGDFSAWVGDNPTGWTVYGEVAADPMVNEVGAGQGHGGAGTGYCNIYTSDADVIDFSQTITTVIGQEYRVRLNINLVADGGIVVTDARHSMWEVEYSTTGVKIFTFVATHTNPAFMIARQGVVSCDVTLDDISITPVKPFSISMWVYMDTAEYFVWASKWQIWGVGSNQEWNIFTGTPTKICFCVYDQSAHAYIGRTYDTRLDSDGADYEEKWTHFVLTYDGGILSSGIKIYLNFNRVDDTDKESGTFVAVENLDHAVWIGGYDGHLTNGLIDDVMFFSKELTAVEVKNIFESTRWRYAK